MSKYTVPLISDREKETIDLNPDLFSATLSDTTLAQVMRVYESNLHQKTKKTKTRSEVAGSTHKIYKQKGTGGARHGSRKAPIFVGGGVSHGPNGVQPGNLKLTQKLKNRALSTVLGSKLDQKAISVLDLPKMDEPSTKSIAKLFAKNQIVPKAILLVYASTDPLTLRQSTQNLESTTLLTAQALNPHKAALSSTLLFTKDALSILEKRLLPDITKHL